MLFYNKVRNQALQRHIIWLEKFKKEMKYRKEEYEKYNRKMYAKSIV